MDIIISADTVFLSTRKELSQKQSNLNFEFCLSDADTRGVNDILDYLIRRCIESILLQETNYCFLKRL